jgi:hypothetical protein
MATRRAAIETARPPAPEAAATVEELKAARERLLARRQQGAEDRAALLTKRNERHFHAFMRGDATAAADVRLLEAQLAESERQAAADQVIMDRLVIELAEADAAALARERAALVEQLETSAATVEAIGAEFDRAVVDVVRPIAARFLEQARPLARHAAMGGRTAEYAVAQAVSAHLADLAPILRNLVDRRMRRDATLANYARSLGVRAKIAAAKETL